MSPINVPETVICYARERALDALTNDASERVVKYYSIDSDYAGALFLGLEPNDPDRFTATDLFAVSTLRVSIPARGARRFLVEQAEQERIAEAMRSLPVGPLECVEDYGLGAMCRFHQMLKEALHPHEAETSNRWVTASKLAARKRPDLFPVRDSLVSSFLGLEKLKTVEQEYVVFRDLMSRPDIGQRLDVLQGELEKRSVEDQLILESSRLRLLDVALWTRAAQERRKRRKLQRLGKP